MAMFYYDGQIRKYIVQCIRMLSGFKYRTGDGLMHSVPVMFGDMSRQAANVLNNNSGNSVQTVPRISIYITSLELNRDLLSDPTCISSVNIRERDTEAYIDGNGQERSRYKSSQGHGYTIDRLSPTPYKLSIRADIWTTNTEQKLQILEQILPLFNPSLDIQTSSNFVDWTSLTTVMLLDVTYSSKSIPAGLDDQDDYASLTFEMPIWLSLPSKVKNLGIIQRVVTNIFDETAIYDDGFIIGEPYDQVITTIGDYDILVNNNKVSLLSIRSKIIEENADSPSPFTIDGNKVNWEALFDLYPSRFRSGVSQIILIQPGGSEIIGTLTSSDTSVDLTVEWDADTYPVNSLIPSSVYPTGRGTIDLIVDPRTYKIPSLIRNGTRYLLLDNIGNDSQQDLLWVNSSGSALKANEGDIIEWNNGWNVILNSKEVPSTTQIYVTNLKTNTQYVLKNNIWVKSIDGEYMAGSWKLII